MNRLTLLSAALVGVALVTGTVMVERASAQARLTKIRTWPPEPDYFVHLRGTSNGLDDGGTTTIFTVPNDKWLVLTDIRIGGYGEIGNGGAPMASVNHSNFAFESDLHGTARVIIDGGTMPTTNPGMTPVGLPTDHGFIGGEAGSWAPSARFSSVAGVSFEPGAVLRIRYKNTTSFDLKGDAAQAHAQWNLVGYFMDR